MDLGVVQSSRTRWKRLRVVLALSAIFVILASFWAASLTAKYLRVGERALRHSNERLTKRAAQVEPVAKVSTGVGPISSDSTSLEDIYRSRYVLPCGLASEFSKRTEPLDLGPTWDQAVCRGERLLEMMNDWKHNLPTFNVPLPDPSRPHAKVDIFKLYGYREAPINQQERLDSDTELDPLMDKLRIPRLGSQYFSFNVDLPKLPNPKPEYQVEIAIGHSPQYDMSIDPRSGTLVVPLAYGTGIAQRDKLTRLSDILYLSYSRVCSLKVPRCSPRSLKRIIRKDIINNTSKQIIERARGDRTDTDRQSVKTFELDSEGYHALLGSVNGLAAAWYIIDHPKWFYAKRIARIYSFKRSLHHLVFEIEDIPNSGPPPPPGPKDPQFPDATDAPNPDITMGEAPPVDTDLPMPDAPPLEPVDVDTSMVDAPPLKKRDWALNKIKDGSMPIRTQNMDVNVVDGVVQAAPAV